MCIVALLHFDGDIAAAYKILHTYQHNTKFISIIIKIKMIGTNGFASPYTSSRLVTLYRARNLTFVNNQIYKNNTH